MFENPLHSKKFLVIDDFGDMRNMLKGMLRTFGAGDIDGAGNGRDAITRLAAKTYDVVLCDYNLGPGKDGQQVLEEARERRLLPVSSVFLMVTAENTREMVMGAVEYEPDTYLSKPFTKELLKTRLDRVMAKRAALAPLELLLRRKDYDGAQRFLDEQLATQPRNRNELIRLKAELCYQAQRYDLAEQICQQVIAVRDLPWARLLLGKIHFERQDYEEARMTFQALIDDKYQLPAAYDWLARAEIALSRPQEALRVLQAGVALSPKAIRRQETIGQLAYGLHDYATAEAAMDQAVKLGRHSVFDHPGLYTGLAKAKCAMNKPDEARKVLADLEKHFEPDTMTRLYGLFGAIGVALSSDDREGAEQQFQEAEVIFRHLPPPLSPALAMEFAKIAAALGKTALAEEILHALVRNHHDDPELLQQVVGAMREVGLNDNPEELVATLKKEIVAMNNRGVALLRQKKIDQAIALFTEAAEGMPANVTINLNTARALILGMEIDGVQTEQLRRVRHYIDRVKAINADHHGLNGITERFRKLLVDA